MDSTQVLKSEIQLPPELRLQINAYLSSEQHVPVLPLPFALLTVPARNRRLQLANRKQVEEGWLYVPYIRVPEQLLSPFVGVGQLDRLVHLKSFIHRPWLNISNSAIAMKSLSTLPRLEKVSLTVTLAFEEPAEGQLTIGEAFCFSTSLQTLHLSVYPVITDNGVPILEYISSNLLSLTGLTLDNAYFAETSSLSLVSKLTKLKKLRLETVRKAPETAADTVAFLRRILPVSISFKHLRIGWIHGIGIYFGYTITSMSDFKLFKELGFDLPALPRDDWPAIFDRWSTRIQRFIQEGWMNPMQLEASVVGILRKIQYQQQILRFREDIFVPIVESKATAACYPNPPTIADYRRMATSMLQFESPSKPGVMYSVLLRVASTVLRTILTIPDQFYFDVHATYSGKPLTYFIKDRQMEIELSSHKLLLHPSQEPEALDFVEEIYADLGVHSTVDIDYYFGRCWANPSYFATNERRILHRCLKENFTATQAAAILERVITSNKPNWIARAFDECTIAASAITQLRYSFPSDTTAFAIFTSGVDKFVKTVLKFDSTFENQQNLLHVLAQRRPSPGSEGFTTPTFNPIMEHFKKDSPLARAADALGKYPVFYWIKAGSLHPELKPSFEALIAHFAVNSNPVDTQGTSLRVHTLRCSLEAARDLAASLPDDGTRKFTQAISAVAVVSLVLPATPDDLETQSDKIMSAYRTITQLVSPRHELLLRRPMF